MNKPSRKIYNDALTCYYCGKIVMELDAVWVEHDDDADPWHPACVDVAPPDAS